MAENYDTSPLPPGWDRKYDHRTGRYYYINYFSKTTTWEDPRCRYRQLNQVTLQHAVSGGVTEQAIQMQDLSNIRPSPIPGRAYSPHTTPYSSPARAMMESTLTYDIEQSVTKINAVFPTVSETHIRALLIKYLKSVFPKADETLLLDILANADNNVQKATEKLQVMGFEKRDTPPPRLTLRKKEEEQKAQERRSATPTPPPRMKSVEEKQKMKLRLQEKYTDIPERVITIALDSVDHDEDRAAQILNIMMQEESKPKFVSAEPVTASKPSQAEESRQTPPHAIIEPPSTSTGDSPSRKTSSPRMISTDKSDKGQNKRSKGKKDVPKVSRGTSTTEDKEYKSPYLMKPCGPNRQLQKGPNDELLLVDYVTWNGANPDLLNDNGRRCLAKGPEASLLRVRSYQPKGPNSELRKGPKIGLAKGSIYSQLSETIEESRGK